jgi:hypothetical protein
MVNSASPKDGKTSHSRQQIIKEFLHTYGRLVVSIWIETDCYFRVLCIPGNKKAKHSK